MALKLTDADYLAAATELGVDVAAIKAVAEVESPRGAYQADGRLSILFEPHVFWRELKARGIDPKKYYFIKKGNKNVVNPEWAKILNETWDSSLYGKYGEQWGKLDKAAAQIHVDSAYSSASYGAFQILGSHYKDQGFASPKAFVDFMQASEANQLKAFVNFIRVNKLDDEIRRKDWAGFAKGYNGPGYKQNQYDTKLAAAYKKHAK